jgi:methylated-DNA-[protein]-cysteine S-methyltransferase
LPADTFKLRVLSIARRIPPGRVVTYGDVAEMAERPGAARAVGNIMSEGGRPDVPAHRVIAAGGRLGGYGGSEQLKRSLLIAEGVQFRGNRVHPFEAFRWRGTSGSKKNRRGTRIAQVL